MEDVTFTIPQSDLPAMVQFAKKMGWAMRTKKSTVEDFIRLCSQSSETLSDEEIMEEVRAVRYNL